MEFIDKNKVRKLGFSTIDCIFKRDPKTGGCLIYEDRPLVCRAYGKKYSLQCPYRGLEEQPKDEAKKKTLVMNNNGALKDTIELKKLMFSKG
jgi:Fe-S-cluster containining protein